MPGCENGGRVTRAVLPDSPTYGEARRQVFDAFGVNVGGYITFRCALDCDYADDPWHLYCGHFSCCPWQGCNMPIGFGPTGWTEPPCPNEPARPVERMQTGGFNWRGGEGSVTDRVLEDMQDSSTHELRWSAYTRPSTGLVYMRARYYDPETGRFTQHDPVPYGMEVLWGQNNRWAYCANDPVNGADPTGLFPVVVVLIGVVAGAAVGYYLGGWQGAIVGAVIGGVAAYLAALAFAEAALGGATASGAVSPRVYEFIGDSYFRHGDRIGKIVKDTTQYFQGVLYREFTVLYQNGERACYRMRVHVHLH